MDDNCCTNTISSRLLCLSTKDTCEDNVSNLYAILLGTYSFYLIALGNCSERTNISERKERYKKTLHLFGTCQNYTRHITKTDKEP